MLQHPLSRRAALASMTGAALTAAGFAAGGRGTAWAAEAGGTFRDVRDFGGTWEGTYDGRRARLRIVVMRQSPGPLHTVFLTFTDLGRNETFIGSREDVPGTAHEIDDIAFRGARALFWPRLLIHTRDTDCLSGTSSRNGTCFPLSFRRVLRPAGARARIA